MSIEPIWLVWNRNGGNPTVPHSTFDKATREAERLARVNPGQMFIVLESVTALVVDNVQRIDMRPHDQPF